MLPQASPQNSPDSQQKFTRSEKKSLDLKFLRRNPQFCLNYLVIYFTALKLYIICKFVKIDHAEA